MQRSQGIQILKDHIENQNLLKHLFATEVCMRHLARYFEEDEWSWAMAGLLHDVDYDHTKNDFPRHGLVAAELLGESGLHPDIIEAIKAHPGHIPRRTLMAKALYAVDPLTGLIVAAALMHPKKSLAAIDVPFILKRFKEKRFAAGANREQIQSCRELDFELDEFIQICLKAMQSISADLGLA